MQSVDEIRSLGVNQELLRILKVWGIQDVTQAQSSALVAGVADGQSLIVSTPTSSGKTLVGEIAVLNGIQNHRQSVYLVSHKALAEQKYSDFVSKFAIADLNASVSLSTGDREEGNLQSDVVVATYEKALVLILSEQLDPTQCTIIADELQILGEKGRGPNIEILCTILKQRGTKQFVALTATLGNPDDIADWLDCKLVKSNTREVPLDQLISFEGSGYQIEFGQETGSNIEKLPTTDLVSTVEDLLKKQLGPVLVFVESRQQASRYAADFSKKRQITKLGIGLVEQFDLFTEPSERSSDLRGTTEKGVAFHSADLTPQERRIIEDGFSSDCFDVCFATSTLAAGVNFPFRSVVFPKLTYQYGDRQGTHLTRSDYRNMSGRAGRLNMHERGLAILLAQDQNELRHANKIVLPENDNVYSQLSELSMRQAVLTLVATGIADREENLLDFLETTYFWHLTREKNPAKLDQVAGNARRAISWLSEVDLIEKQNRTYFPTKLGQATARSGLLPQTAVDFAYLIREHSEKFGDQFESCITGIIHWICGSEEFVGDKPSRFLPYASGGNTPGSYSYVSTRLHFRNFDRTNSQLNQNVHALSLYIEGIIERHINRATNITSGSLHRVAMDVSWILDGLHTISSVPDLDCSQLVTNQLAILSRRVRWGSPANALDLIRIAERAGVPGFGRQRAMQLVKAGIVDFDDVARSGITFLEEILGNRVRAEALLTAVSTFSEVTSDRLNAIHESLASKLELSTEVARCLESIGTEYENAIVDLLRKNESWTVVVVDDGSRKNVPDILLTVGGRSVLIEMKTTTKHSGLIKKDEAFAVIQKAMNFEKSLGRVTLGKPYFDELSKENAISSVEAVTLVEHACFMEAVLRVLGGSMVAEDFMSWLIEPGLAEFDRMPGKRTDLLL